PSLMDPAVRDVAGSQASVQQCSERRLRLSSTASRVQRRVGGGRGGLLEGDKTTSATSIDVCEGNAIRATVFASTVLAERLEHFRAQSVSFPQSPFFRLSQSFACGQQSECATTAEDAGYEVAAACRGGQVTAPSYQY